MKFPFKKVESDFVMNLKVGDTFQIDVNQGSRTACIVAILSDKFLYEYEMPNGTTCLRNHKDKPISYRNLPDKWVKAISEQYGILNLVCEPQQCGSTGAIKDRLLERAQDLDVKNKP